jgi:hypothetical protein
VGEVIRRTKGGKRHIMASKQPTHTEARRMLAAHPVALCAVQKQL